jgi:rod shape determining protein RodA
MKTRDQSLPRRGLSFALPRSPFSLRGLRWFEVDWHVLAIAALLLVLGVALVHAMAQADETYERNGVDFKRHLGIVALTLPMVLLGMSLRPRWLRKKAWLLYAGCVTLLLLLPFIGSTHNGSRRWIRMPGAFDLQPSELAKIGLVLALARVLYRNRLERLKDWGPPLAAALIPMGLVAKQPDLGTAMSFVPITLGMLYVAGARAKVIGLFLAGAAVVVFLACEFRIGPLHGYQFQRIHTWLDGFHAKDLIRAKNGPAFHSYRARVSIGEGGTFGTGLGDGVANRTGSLPERDCDSVFAVIAGELGFVPTAGVMTLYMLMIALLLGSASGIRDRFSRLAAGGIAMYFAAHFMINVSVNLGLIPMTGITLPLFSTGGSSLLTTFLALGLAVGLAAHSEPALDKDAFQT